MIIRKITPELLRYTDLYPVVSITGPRQSGKTTLVKMTFPDYDYYSLEDPDIRSLALNDPRKFLQIKRKGIIIDEVQRVPDLFSYIQSIVDENKKEGQFILTGSQNFLLLEKVSQTLAGRVAILKLLPFSISELKHADFNAKDADELIVRGFYPGIYDKKLNPADFYPFYIQTYVERDVKQIRNISDQSSFIRFLGMCAGRSGQMLNISELANSCGINQLTAKAWLSILEASYVVYFLQPHHKNFNKRLVKMPRLYFYDTGLLCSLLGIKNKEQLTNHFAIGQIFENFIVNEFVKYFFNKAERPDLYFWRDKNGHEIDLILQKGKKLIPIEIKAGKTFSTDYFKNIKYWNKLSDNKPENSYVVYNGERSFDTSSGKVVAFNDIKTILTLVD